ncbi:hypothetical protein FKM82_019036 [Ascaphus truei]
MGNHALVAWILALSLGAMLINADNKKGNTFLSESDPGRCMRHHYVDSINHPQHKCTAKVQSIHIYF